MVYLYGNRLQAPTPAAPAVAAAATAPAAPPRPSQPMYTTGVSMLVVAIICMFIGLILNVISHQMVASSAIAKKVVEKDTVRSTKTLLIVTVFFNIAVLLFSCVMLFLVFMNRSNQSFQDSMVNNAIMMIGGFLMVVMFVLQVVANQKVARIITEAPEFKTAAGLSATSVAFIGLGFVACMAYIVPMVTVKCVSTGAIASATEAATKSLKQRAETAEARVKGLEAQISTKAGEVTKCNIDLGKCNSRVNAGIPAYTTATAPVSRPFTQPGPRVGFTDQKPSESRFPTRW